jgi:hypothetical protein
VTGRKLSKDVRSRCRRRCSDTARRSERSRCASDFPLSARRELWHRSRRRHRESAGDGVLGAERGTLGEGGVEHVSTEHLAGDALVRI